MRDDVNVSVIVTGLDPADDGVHFLQTSSRIPRKINDGNQHVRFYRHKILPMAIVVVLPLSTIHSHCDQMFGVVRVVPTEPRAGALLRKHHVPNAGCIVRHRDAIV